MKDVLQGCSWRDTCAAKNRKVESSTNSSSKLHFSIKQWRNVQLRLLKESEISASVGWKKKCKSHKTVSTILLGNHIIFISFSISSLCDESSINLNALLSHPIISASNTFLHIHLSKVIISSWWQFVFDSHQVTVTLKRKNKHGHEVTHDCNLVSKNFTITTRSLTSESWQIVLKPKSFFEGRLGNETREWRRCANSEFYGCYRRV